MFNHYQLLHYFVISNVFGIARAVHTNTLPLPGAVPRPSIACGNIVFV